MKGLTSAIPGTASFGVVSTFYGKSSSEVEKCGAIHAGEGFRTISQEICRTTYGVNSPPQITGSGHETSLTSIKMGMASGLPTEAIHVRSESASNIQRPTKPGEEKSSHSEAQATESPVQIIGGDHALRARAELNCLEVLLDNEVLSASISASRVTRLIKAAVESMGFVKSSYALHSVRIGYATALFEVGNDELVTRLAGRWWSGKGPHRRTTSCGDSLLLIATWRLGLVCITDTGSLDRLLYRIKSSD